MQRNILLSFGLFLVCSCVDNMFLQCERVTRAPHLYYFLAFLLDVFVELGGGLIFLFIFVF